MGQYLERSRGLNERHRTAIRRLEGLCNQFESLVMKLNWGSLHKRPKNEINDFLYYRDTQLVGYLALYTFNRKEAEVSAMTHPAYRRQGIFKELLAAARTELQKRRVPSILFICERGSASGAASVQALGARYEFSEYKMTFQEGARPLPAVAELNLRLAVPADLDALAYMDQLCFDIPAEIARRHLGQDLADDRRRLWVATIGQERVGKAGVSTEDSAGFIYALCVLPEYRGKGYGRTILARLVADLLARNVTSVSLEVACENEAALSLYQRAGFQVVTAYDYYRLPV